MYTEKSCNFLSSPSLTLINSTKSISLVSVRDFFDKVAVIFNLSAPGAAKLILLDMMDYLNMDLTL